jgi:hypothetical protein
VNTCHAASALQIGIAEINPRTELKPILKRLISAMALSVAQSKQGDINTKHQHKNIFFF